VLIESGGPQVSVVGLDNVIVVVYRTKMIITFRACAQQVGKLHGAANQ